MSNWVTQVTYKELRAVIPPELFEKSTLRGLFSFAQDVVTVCALYALCLRIDAVEESLTHKFGLTYPTSVALHWTLWAAYWGAQGIAMAGCWCLGSSSSATRIII
jgi:omega-6 fatty acid desaturase (delta-12 desaturase)